jgi:hypothetical protein
MARPSRLEIPGALYYVLAHGNAGTRIFVKNAERRHFLDLLGREVSQQRWICHGYCLLDDGYRLLIETPEANLGRGLGRLNAVYSQWFNRRHGRSGHLFQGRYKAIIAERSRWLAPLARELALQPVQAGLVRRPGQWPWGSYRAIAKGRDRPAWLTADAVLAALPDAGRAPTKALKRYVAGHEDASPLDEVRSQIYLGGDDFRKRMAAHARAMLPVGTPRAVLRPDRPDAQHVMDAVATAAGVPVERALDRAHRQDVYQATVYLLRRGANLTLKETAARAGVSPGRISQIQRRIDEAGGLERAFAWAKPLLPLIG